MVNVTVWTVYNGNVDYGNKVVVNPGDLFTVSTLVCLDDTDYNGKDIYYFVAVACPNSIYTTLPNQTDVHTPVLGHHIDSGKCGRFDIPFIAKEKGVYELDLGVFFANMVTNYTKQVYETKIKVYVGVTPEQPKPAPTPTKPPSQPKPAPTPSPSTQVRVAVQDCGLWYNGTNYSSGSTVNVVRGSSISIIADLIANANGDYKVELYDKYYGVVIDTKDVTLYKNEKIGVEFDINVNRKIWPCIVVYNYGNVVGRGCGWVVNVKEVSKPTTPTTPSQPSEPNQPSQPSKQKKSEAVVYIASINYKSGVLYVNVFSSDDCTENYKIVVNGNVVKKGSVELKAGINNLKYAVSAPITGNICYSIGTCFRCINVLSSTIMNNIDIIAIAGVSVYAAYNLRRR